MAVRRDDHDVNTLLVEVLIHGGEYSMRAVSRYFREIYAAVLTFIANNPTSIHHGALKRAAMMSAYCFGSVTLHPRTPTASTSAYPLTYYRKEDGTHVPLRQIKFVLGMWKFTTGPMFFLMNGRRTKSLLIHPGVRASVVCWDSTLNCDQVKVPPDRLVFIQGSSS